MMEVKTKAGIIKVYENADHGAPGVCVMLQPKGTDCEIDLAYVEVTEDPEYRLDPLVTEEDVLVYMFGNPYTEDCTSKSIIKRSDVVKALEI